MAKKEVKSYDPFETLFSMREDLDSIFKDFFTGFNAPASGRRVFPAMDVKETADNYLIEVEVPGMDRDDMKLSIKKDELVLEGEKKEENKEEGESFLRIERSYGSFRRTIRLPSEVDQAGVKANYVNGVLKITLPKTEEEKPKEIEVEVE